MFLGYSKPTAGHTCAPLEGGAVNCRGANVQGRLDRGEAGYSTITVNIVDLP